MLVAALGKAAQLPFSFWLSRAMVGPSPVSALLHSAAMVAMGGYLLLRAAPLLQATGWADSAAAWVGAVTALLLGAVAVAQRDLKQLLAASTAAQLGFVVLAAGASAVAGGAAHLVAHAATKALLFLAAGRLALRAGHQAARPRCGAPAGAGPSSGPARRSALSPWPGSRRCRCGRPRTPSSPRRASVPPRCMSSGWPPPRCPRRTPGRYWSSCGSRHPRGSRSEFDDERRGTRHVGVLEQAPLVVLAAGAALLGLLALPPVADVLRRALGAEDAPVAGVAELAGSAALALLVLVAVWRWRLPEPGWAARWLGLEAAAHAVVVRPALRLAEVLARFDDRVLDRAVDRRGPRRGSRPAGRPPGPTRAGSTPRWRPWPGESAGSVRWPGARRPGSCTSTTSRPPWCSRPPSSCSWS